MKFTLDYEIDKKSSKEDLKKVKRQAYISFCVEFVNYLSEKLNLKDYEETIESFELDDEGEKIQKNQDVVRFSIDLPRIKIKKTCPRREIEIAQKNGTPYTRPNTNSKNVTEKEIKEKEIDKDKDKGKDKKGGAKNE